MSAADMEMEKQAIWRPMAELEAAENRKDIAGILELMTEDFVFVVGDSKIEGKAAMAETLKESAKNYVSSKHARCAWRLRRQERWPGCWATS